MLMSVTYCVISVVIAFRGETRRSFSLPDNKLAASSLSPQPTSSASSSLIASIDENCLRSPVDSGTPPQCTIDRTSSSTDAKSPVCDVIVTSHDVQSPIRNVRPALLDIAAVQSPRVDSSPDDRRQLVGILLNRSPRRNSLLRFVILFTTARCNLLVVNDVRYCLGICIC